MRWEPLGVGDGEADGYWRPGMIFADVPADNPAVREEILGPVLTVQAVD